jgi:predicted deacylase
VSGNSAHVDPHVVELRDELLATASYYSANYFEARERFLAAAAYRQLPHHALRIHAPSPNGESLTIDIAIAGAAKPKTALVLSSGVHGVEAPFGSAVQLAFMEQQLSRWQLPADAAVVLIHAINPFGYAWRRRFNENNVDLNRNFLLANEAYSGAPPLASQFRSAMKLLRPRARFGFWSARMVMLALRHGASSIWETLPVGQYDYPDWLFFGGAGPSQSGHALQNFLPSVLDEAEEVAHLDFHTGLGSWATGELLVSESEGLGNCEWWRSHFGADQVTQVKSFTKSYEVRGGFGPWLRALFPQCDYRYATAEFGTYSAIRVISALAEESRWHGELGHSSLDHDARVRLEETFAPRSRSWRTKTLKTALEWTRQAAGALWKRDYAA